MQNVRTGTETVVEYPSANGTDTVVGYFYEQPEVRPKAIVQISHGMMEYIRRYQPLAWYLAEHGYAVCGNDHLGHGATSGDTGRDGYFAEENGVECVLQDLHTMTGQAHSRWPGLPLILLGHSMGSFFARLYAERFGDELDGLVLSGTAGPNPMGGIGIALTKLLITFKGSMATSPFVEKIAFGAYCKRIPDAVTGKEWVTSDPDVLAAYTADPKCSFPFTVSGYHDLMEVLTLVNRKQWFTSLPLNLPVYLIAGEEDPVGDYGKGVRLVADRLKESGLEDVTLRLYPGCRHEVHNEKPADRELMYTELLAWLDAHI